MSVESELVRISDALERIADALAQPTQLNPGHTTVQIDGKTVADAVVRYTMRHAARGPSSLVGGSLASPRRSNDEHR